MKSTPEDRATLRRLAKQSIDGDDRCVHPNDILALLDDIEELTETLEACREASAINRPGM